MSKIVLLISLVAILFNAYAKVDTIYVNSLEEFEKSLLNETVEVQPIQHKIRYNTLSDYELRRSNGLIAGGIALIVTGASILPGGTTISILGFAFEEGPIGVLGVGVFAAGVAGIAGGVKMIHKGKRIRRRGRRFSFNPSINPLEKTYGANLSLQF